MSHQQPVARKPRWGQLAIVLAIVVGPPALLLSWCTAAQNRYDGSHRRAAAALLDALDAYRKQHGAYPARVRDLQPAHLPEKLPFDPGVRIFFVTSEARDDCWLGYTEGPPFMMPSDTFHEVDCAKREWRTLEYGEAKTTPHAGVDVIEIP